MATVEEPKFDVWTGDILLGIGADKDTVSLLHVGAMVRMIYDKGRIVGEERAAETAKMSMTRITGLSELKLSLMQNDSNLVILEKIKEEAFARGKAEGAEQMKADIRRASVPVIPGAYLYNTDEGEVITDPAPSDNPKGYPVQVFLVGAEALDPKEK